MTFARIIKSTRPVIVLRDCAVCGGPVPKRPYQRDDARACRPQCAKKLAYREDPGLGGFKSSANGV